MFGSLFYCLTGTLIIGSLLCTECYGVLSKDENSLMEAAKNEEWDEMLEIANKGVNVDIEDENGLSPLSYASDYSDATVVEKLIKVGVENIVKKRIASGDKGDKEQMKTDVTTNLVNKRNLPILNAVSKGNKGIFDILVKYGADPKKVTTLLHYTAPQCNKELAHILIDKYGLNVNETQDYQETPLHAAAYYNCGKAFMKIFTTKGADVNAPNQYGKTPLHKAAFSDSKIAVKALIELGANLEKGDEAGITPLQDAEEEASDDVIKMLQNAINATKSGKSDAGAHKSTTAAGAHAKASPPKVHPKESKP